MAENQKDSVKKSFWQRNLFLIIIVLIIIVAGGGYLYKNNILKFSFSSQSPTPSPVKKEIITEIPTSLDSGNKELQDKVDRLENLILELAENVQNIPQTSNVETKQEPQKVVLSNDEAYDLILSINQIITHIDQQQLRNKQVQKLQNQYLFFRDQKFEELLTLPDYTYLLQQLSQSEQSFVQNEFMKNNNMKWMKNIISNIFEINIAKSKSSSLASYINAILNRQYANAIVEFEKLSSDQKIYFQSTYDLAQLYNTNQLFLENMI
jgi:hypothetical protein